jgi:nitric oxide reductase subunit B
MTTLHEPTTLTAPRAPAVALGSSDQHAVAVDRVVAIQFRMALACIVLAVLGGAMSVLHYLPAVSVQLNAWGLTFPQLRPVHTTFATLWIYGAGVAVVYHWLAHQGAGLTRGDLLRFRFHTACWIGAGVAMFATLLAGVTSGREYLEFHPAFAAPLLIGWLAFAWTFLKRALPSFWGCPVYVYMWTVGVLLFVYAFLEAHAWLLPGIGDRPVRDMQLQWKSCGTLVGSFNFLVYGTLTYVRERIANDSRPGQSGLAFALFGVGCLNSFTNYVHHTYHLPQNHTVKWIAFLVSMAEIVILWRVMTDVVRGLRARAPEHPTLRFFASARHWTASMLALAIAISIPNLNSIIHGGHVVAAHAMGAEIGIDSMVLFGALVWFLHDQRPRSRRMLTSSVVRWNIRVLNVAAAALVTWLFAVGSVNGWTRFHGEPPPAWVTGGWWLFPVLGGTFAVALLALVARWAPLAFGRPDAAARSSAS